MRTMYLSLIGNTPHHKANCSKEDIKIQIMCLSL